MKWPWTSRARLDDALQLLAEHRTKIADLEAENRHLVNQIFVRHGVRPVYKEPGDFAAIQSVMPPPAPPVDVMQQAAPTVINEVRKSGARSAREIAAGVEKVLGQRHQAQAKVARELEAVMSAPSTGNGNH